MMMRLQNLIKAAENYAEADTDDDRAWEVAREMFYLRAIEYALSTRDRRLNRKTNSAASSATAEQGQSGVTLLRWFCCLVGPRHLRF